jgi:hypothetical protein
MLRLPALVFIVVLAASGCTKEISCDACGYYTGVSQKVDYLPGSPFGSYTTTTVTHEVWEEAGGYTTAGFLYKPDVSGYFYDAPDSIGQVTKGYISLEVILRNDTLNFEIHKPGGLSEIYNGIKVN